MHMEHVFYFSNGSIGKFNTSFEAQVLNTHHFMFFSKINSSTKDGGGCIYELLKYVL